MASLVEALEAAPVVIDGGLGTLLEARGHDLTSSLWSARLLLDQPEVIRAAHAEFFEAGARVAITASYQVSYEALEAEGLDPREVDLLLARSVQLAGAARADAGLNPGEAWVAASVGPYGASRADGSEYTGAYGIGVDELRAWHRPRLRALAAAGADVLAVETLPSLDEVTAVTRELSGLGVPAWISVTIADGRLRSGESLADAFALAAASPEVIAVGVNCCDVAEVAGALAVARTVTRQAARGVSEQRRGLARRLAELVGRPCAARSASRGVGGRGRTSRRRMLPGGSRPDPRPRERGGRLDRQGPRGDTLTSNVRKGHP